MHIFANLVTYVMVDFIDLVGITNTALVIIKIPWYDICQHRPLLMVTRYKEDFHIFLVDQGIYLIWYVEKLMFISTNDLCTYVQ